MAERSDRIVRFPIGPILRVLGWGTFMSAMGVGIVLILYDVQAGHKSPYTGVITYLLIPIFIGIGLTLIAIGWILKLRNRAKSGDQPGLALVIDFNEPQHVKKIVMIGLTALVFGCVSAVGGYRTYHYTESLEFCGITCHKVMTPEYTTYQKSPHASVGCAECHIGAGADWYVKSKLSGLRQVQAYITETYELPVQTPIKNLRPARETCEECHWPEVFSGDLQRTHIHYLRDEENTPYVVRLLLKVGGKQGKKATGIHWHVSSGYQIEYVSTDPQRMVIPYVKMTDPDGNSTVFTSEDYDPEILNATYEHRIMDCIDCHNRPSHIFREPEDLINDAITNGDIDIHLPNVKDLCMTLLAEQNYPTTEKALSEIENTFREEYLSGSDVKGTTLEETVEKAVRTLQDLYKQNFFPEMGVDWTTHPNFAGHFHWDGCYRCHDGNHTSESGEVISHDCNSCHLIIGQAEGFENIENVPYEIQDFNHPADMGPLEEGTKCTDCHAAPEPTDYRELVAEAENG